MPSPAATTVTRAHRRELALLTAVVTRRVARAADSATPADIDGWFDAASPTLVAAVAAGHDTAARLAGRYLRRHAAVEGRVVDPVLARANLERIATSLRVTGPVAFKTHMGATGDPAASRMTMISRLAGASERLTLAGDRTTVMETFRRSGAIVGWRRITGGSPCAFCAALASRGATYSKDSVEFAAHDRDMCSAEPIYETEREPASVLALRDEWDEVTAEVSGSEKLTVWQAHWRSRGA